MKKTIVSFMMCLLCLAFAVPAFAQEESVSAPLTEETAQDSSQPRLMVSSYKCDILTPAEDGAVEITFKNYSSKKAVYNIKLSVADESGDIRSVGLGTKYVDKIKAGGSYKWSVPVSVAKTAVPGEHKLTVSAEYEDKYYTPYSSADTLAVTVMQSVSLDYDGLSLPKKVTQGETASISVSFMNTGKSTVRNCKVRFDADGLQTGGTLFIGEIPAGESTDGTVNFNVSRDMLGEISGTAELSYEDELGEQYSQTLQLSTVIEVPAPEKTQEEKEESKYPLWWLFIIVGAVCGGTAGFMIPAAIRARKQRLEDEKRL